VRLSSPPPLERPLTVERQGSVTLLLDGTHQIASGATAPAPEIDLPTPATAAEAAEAETRYEGLSGHPFPTCFSCGPDRSPMAASGMPRAGLRSTPPSRSCGLRWTAPGVGPPGSPVGRWCWGR
jgi:hypothetical protein